MGSTGTGRFSDYPKKKGEVDHDDAAQAGGSIRDESGAGSTICDRPLEAVELEEVRNAEYYLAHNALPAVGSPVVVGDLSEGRIEVRVTDSGQVVGYLPTKFNHIWTCKDEEGRDYEGNVVSNREVPSITVRIDLRPVDE